MIQPRLSHDVPQVQLRKAMAELEQQLAAGQQAQAEEWLKRLPELAADTDLALEFVYGEYVVRESLGQQPQPEEYYARFPALQERLRRLFDVDALLHHGNDRHATAFETQSKDGIPSIPGEVQFSTLRLLHKAADRVFLPDTFGDFQPLDRLGSGGMGVVYRARQKSLQRIVALKVIREEAASIAETHERFLREAKIVAGLEHPHIVRIHEVGEQDGRLYLALEYVPGTNLRQFLNGKPLPPLQAAELTKILACTMQFAHEHQIVHRDLKPANILLHSKPETRNLMSSEGKTEIRNPKSETNSKSEKEKSKTEEGKVSEFPPSDFEFVSDFGFRISDFSPKVTDFGLAAHLSGQGELTSMGRILGTPCYMAPEQARGAAGWSTPAVDVYALGAILYETLTGRPPFVSDSDLETLRLVVETEPVRPSRLQPKVPQDLEIICLKCLEKEPARRYPTAGALADDLERFRNQEPIQARPAGWWERTAKWARRHPARAALWLVCLLGTLTLAVVIITYTAWLTDALTESDRQRRLAEENERKAQAAVVAETQRRQQARQALDALTSEIVEDWLSQVPSLEPRHREFLEQALRQYEAFAAEVGQDEASRAGVALAYERMTRIQMHLGRKVEAEKAAQRSVELFFALARDYPEQDNYLHHHALCLNQRGIARLNQGQLTQAEQDFRAALEIWRGLTQGQTTATVWHKSMATTYANYGSLLSRQGRLEEAEPLCKNALACWDALLATAPRDIYYLRQKGHTLTNLGTAQRYLGRPEAEVTLKAAFEITERLTRHDPASTEYRAEHAWHHLNVGMMLMNSKRPAEAERLFRSGMKLYERLRDERPNVPAYRHEWAKLQNAVGLALEDLRLTRDANTAYRAALKEFEALVQNYPDDPEFKTSLAGSLSDYGNLLRRYGQAKMSLEHFTRAENLLTELLRQERQQFFVRRFLLETYKGFSEALKSENRHLEAAAMWQRSETWLGEIFFLSSRIERALALSRAGKHVEGLALAAPLPAEKMTRVNRFGMAALYALAAGSGDPSVRENSTSQAKAILTDPGMAALLQQTAFAYSLRMSKDWAAFRSETWFQQLINGLKPVP